MEKGRFFLVSPSRRVAVISGLTLSGDAVLYTITTNTVFRIYSPVLDDPTWFQLLSSIDHRAFRSGNTGQSPAGKGKGKDEEIYFGRIWPLDAEILRAGLLDALSDSKEGNVKPSAMTRKILEGLATDESDVLLYTDRSGTISLRSIVVRFAVVRALSYTRLITAES